MAPSSFVNKWINQWHCSMIAAWSLMQLQHDHGSQWNRQQFMWSCSCSMVIHAVAAWSGIAYIHQNHLSSCFGIYIRHFSASNNAIAAMMILLYLVPIKILLHLHTVNFVNLHRNVKSLVSKTCIHISDAKDFYIVRFILIVPHRKHNCHMENPNNIF